MRVEHTAYEDLKKQRDKLMDLAQEVAKSPCTEVDNEYCLRCLAKQILEEIKGAN